jgi:hypothetical protein
MIVPLIAAGNKRDTRRLLAPLFSRPLRGQRGHMKNQYFGDIQDYRKYGLLRQLTEHGKCVWA